MNTRTAFQFILAGITLFTVNAQEPKSDKGNTHDLAGWGTALTPDQDCKFFVTGDSLLINVPGTHPHDLAADIGTTNAPRVTQSVTGDFTVQVVTDGRFTPGAESTQSERTGYNGAAVIAMLDQDNVVTLARAVLQHPGEAPRAYANFEIRVDGKLLRIGKTGDHPLPKNGPVHLRLERRGMKFLGAVSTDGTNWDILDQKDVPESWPKELKTGVAAISTSKEEFNPTFSKFQILK